MHKMIEKTVKKSCSHAKYEFFENALKSLKRIQIEFWIAEKIGIESFTCFSKTWEIP